MLRLYNTALFPLRAVVALRAAWAARDPDRRLEWDQRWARRLPEARPGAVWIHGASVGEARLVGHIAEGLHARRPDLPIVASAYTTTGRHGLPAPPVADAAFFVPLDFRGLATRVLRALRPCLLTLVETELWPNLLDETHSAGVPAAVLNARLSPRRMGRYRRLGGLYRPMLERLAAIGAQSTADAERFRQLGARPESIFVTGNLKYDLPQSWLGAVDPRQRLGPSAGRPLFVAGSTAPGEEQPVLDAFTAARHVQPDLLLALAPRHPDRADEVARLLEASHRSFVRYSTDRTLEPSVDVLLVDTVGHLPGLYRAACIAFVGGSLLPVGGHNVLEPASVGVPVLFGPHTEHFADPAERLERAGGGRRVRDGEALGRALVAWLEQPAERAAAGAAARAVVEENRGALERSLDLLLKQIDGSDRRESTGAA